MESPESEAEIAEIGRALRGVPLLANMVEGGRTPLLPPQRLQELGYAMAIWPAAGFLAAAAAIERAYAALRAEGGTFGLPAGSLYGFERMTELMGFPRDPRLRATLGGEGVRGHIGRMPPSPHYRPSRRHAELGEAFYDIGGACALPAPHPALPQRALGRARAGLERLTDAEWIEHFGRFRPLARQFRPPAGAALPRPSVPRLQPRSWRRARLPLRPAARMRWTGGCSTSAPRDRGRRLTPAARTGG